MKRRNFLKGFAAAVAVVTVAPLAIASEDNSVFDTKRLQDRIDFLRRYPLTPEEAFSPKEALEFYNRTGILIWRRRGTHVDWENYRDGTQDIEAYKKAFE